MTDNELADAMDGIAPMTPADREAQRRSFAYGNIALSNPHVTRELVDEVADDMARDDLATRDAAALGLMRRLARAVTLGRAITAWGVLGWLSATVLAATMLSGCGPDARADAHTALDVIADVANPSYALAVETCDELEMVIVRRDSTREEDDRDLARVREVCDEVFRGFEAIRLAHRETRAMVDAEESGTVLQAAVAGLLRLWGDLQALVPEIRGLLGGAS